MMKMKRKWVWGGVLCLAAVLLFTSEAVWAQFSPVEIENVSRIVGIGIGMAPDYIGSDDSKFVAVPFLRYNFSKSERYLLLRGFEFEFNAVDHPWFRLGPVLNLRSGRGDVENNQVERMKNIGSTFEGGAFVGAEFKDKTNPRQRLLLSVRYLYDLGGEYNGSLTTGSIKGWLPLSKRFDASLGVSTSFGSSDYMDTYFGVDAEDSLRSGFRRYSADTGFRDVSINPGIVMHLNKTWHVGAGVRYMRLVGDAEDSPVVKVGDKSQWMGGVGVAYSW
jgi:outer membrane protein